MSKEIYISSTPHETRLAIVESDELTEMYYERENEYTLAGSIYNGKVTRVLPGMQSSFVDIGLERDAFLYITDFMEEAGDSADFDHSGETQRQPRLENGRSESQRPEAPRGTDRGGRGSESREPAPYVSERNQEQAAATPDRDLALASEGRGGEFGNRNEGRNARGGRGRNRGRRDRNGSGDRPALDRNAAPVERSSEEGNRFPQTAVPTEDAPEEILEERAGTEAGARAEMPRVDPEVGEGAPGADGSRRWRGRRGRRRGRGTGSREGVPQAVAGISPEPGSPPMDFYGADAEQLEEPASFDIDGSAAAQETPASVANSNLPMPETEQNVAPRTTPSNDRGGREGRGDRTQRGGRNDRAPRVPRGFAPRSSLYGVENTPEPADAAASAFAGEQAEPLILPGESLGKYRKDSEATAASAATQQASIAQPDTSFKVDPNWDGGAMLPGETLSRYRGGNAPPSTASHAPRGGQRSDSRRPEGGRREGRGENRPERHTVRLPETGPATQAEAGHQPTAPMMVPSTVLAADLQSAGPVSGYAQKGEFSVSIGHRPDFVHTELPEPTAEAPHADSHGEASQMGQEHQHGIDLIHAGRASQSARGEGEPEREYDPQEASASYRIDPVAPSEYRQSSPSVLDADRVEGQGVDIAPSGEMFSPGLLHYAAEEPETGSLNSLLAASEPVAIDSASVETVYADSADGPPEPLHAMTAPEKIYEGEPGTSEITTIEATGDMFPHPEIAAAGPAQGLPSDEAAVDLTHLPPEEISVESGGGQQGFAPGLGDLEEDFIEEEEFDGTTLHAQASSEFDDLEEEQLEGAADLGTMIRDMSLDHMTRTEGINEEEDEDFEEDTLEEDAEYAAHDEAEDVDGPADGFDGQDLQEDGEGLEGKIGFDSSPDRPEAETVGSEPGGTDNQRRTRRDSGRRGGRGDRARGGNREGSDRNAPADRSAMPDANGFDRGGSERNGSERTGSERNGSDRASSERAGYDRGGLGERARNTGGSGDRGRSGGGRGRQSMQSTNLPAISELLKPGQEILCQIAKEPIAKKGARITSHIALPGRFLVFMPTVSHTGVSRKIESDGERRRLKEILLSEKGEAAGGFIVRTAAAGASEEELRSDLRFLLNLWADIKQRSESSKSPALIYHDLNLVERILRDQVTDNFSAIWVDTETEYERVLRFLQRFQPGLIRRVKLYTKETPLFEQFGITEEINKALRSKVWLKSGGSIVINQTEALVAIDINTGKFVGKTARLEDTIVKTNLDAIPEIVRQIRLRDLGGIIIIDFIDMDERRNRNRVMAALEDELKSDRAPSKVLPFNDFGLVAITRKRVKQSLERTLSTTCNVCTGTGMVKSPVTVCNDIYVEMRKMHKHLDRGDVMLRVHPEVVKQLKLTGSRWLQEMEEMCGKTILIKSDPSLHPEQFDIH